MDSTVIVTTHRWEINSLTNPLRVPPVVSMHSNGYFECTCVQGNRDGRRRYCAHILRVLANLVELTTAPRTVAVLPALPTPPVGYTGRKFVDAECDLVIEEREVVIP